MLRLTPQDVFVGSPPLAFTFGLGGLAIFPLRFGATATLLENASPANMIEIIETYKATISVTSPTAYRAMMAAMDEGADLSSLRMAISAGETLPAPVFEDWTRKTGKPILDGIGTTELLHIFISNRLGDAAPGVTGRPVTGYEARIVDDAMKDVPDGTSEMPHVLINQARVHDMFMDVMRRSPTRLEPDYGLKVVDLSIDPGASVVSRPSPGSQRNETLHRSRPPSSCQPSRGWLDVSGCGTLRGGSARWNRGHGASRSSSARYDHTNDARR